jgi:hypothetical protein
MVEGGEEFKLCFELEGSPEVGGEGGWCDGVGLKPLEGLDPCVGICVTESAM